MKHKHTVLLACACALTALVGATRPRPVPGPPPPAAAAVPAPAPDLDLIERLILRHRTETWRWERVMGVRLTRTLPHSPVDPGRRAAAWQQLAVNMRRRARNVPHKSAWLCIHRFEGAWTDPNPPYYGGLQMDPGVLPQDRVDPLPRHGPPR